MGTRADFYVGRGLEAEWLGSIAWDGYEVPDNITYSTNEDVFRSFVSAFLKERDDATFPEDGWPWPWESSYLTDFVYAFDEGQVWACCFNRFWWDAKKSHNFSDEEYEALTKEYEGKVVFPNMEQIQKVNLGKRSGLIIIGVDK